ncbi:DASH complex subunit Ask1-domain-containing protein [Amanita rubescens]|nr:DASH complex subunit Ask1-domain-containing protein [Amanita rubescens]
MSDRPIPPNPPNWTPNPHPASIHIPGLDTNAPINDQIDQIEQLITIKLQNIDENFSKVHNTLANKILPAVKRYAVGTEPVREAAKFWTSFYEQAAQIRIPTFDDHETVNENTESERDDPELTVQPQSDSVEPSMSTSESSFMPGQHAYSSTPAIERTTHAYSNTDDQSDAGSSWAASVESPLVRLDREIQDLAREVQLDTPNAETSLSLSLDSIMGSQARPQSAKGKGREDAPLLRNVLRQNVFSVDATPGDTAKVVSPLKFKGKTKTPISKTHNPYLPTSIEPERWSGVVDLSNATPRGLKGATKASRTVKDQDESFDGLPAGMSPPVLMSPARPPRSSAELGFLRLGKTPGKEASTRISNDLIREIQQKSAKARRMFGYPLGGAESSSMTSSTVPTPPSLSRYTRHGMDDDDSILAPGADSDSDSLDEINNTAHPSAAFLMASQRQADADDSFGSSNHSDDSLIAEEAANLGIAPIHPFARGVEGAELEVDDSFDDDSMLVGGGGFQEETLFGVPPAERLRAEQLRAAGQLGQLHLPGQELLEDTIGIGAQFARTGRVEETPTPAVPWDRRQG